MHQSGGITRQNSVEASRHKANEIEGHGQREAAAATGGWTLRKRAAHLAGSCPGPSPCLLPIAYLCPSTQSIASDCTIASATVRVCWRQQGRHKPLKCTTMEECGRQARTSRCQAGQTGLQQGRQARSAGGFQGHRGQCRRLSGLHGMQRQPRWASLKRSPESNKQASPSVPHPIHLRCARPPQQGRPVATAARPACYRWWP